MAKSKFTLEDKSASGARVSFQENRPGGGVPGGSLLPTSRDYAFIEFGHRGEPLPSAPHDGRTRRRVVFSVEIPTETSDRDQRLPYRWRGRRQFLFEAFE